MFKMMDTELRTALKQLLELATSPGYMPDLREVLSGLPTENLYALQREVKDAIGEKMAGAPVVVFDPNIRYRKIDAIKLVRVTLGSGLREAKDMVENGRVLVDSFDKAQRLAESLNELGAKATVQAQ